MVRVDADGVAHRQDMGETTILVRYLDQQTAVQLAFVPARPGFVWPNPPEPNDIDRHVFAKLRTLRMAPSGALRPTPSSFAALTSTSSASCPRRPKYASFLADTRPDKRARLIDALLERPEFADFWALKWSDLLHSEEKALDRKGVQVFHDWIRHSIADGKPLNEFARELIAGRGSTYSHPAANYYRALRDPQHAPRRPPRCSSASACSAPKCHNHPFDRWTQTDYHSLAAFFSRVRVSHPREQPQRQARQARVRRRTDRVHGSHRRTQASGQRATYSGRVSWAPTRRRSLPTPTACRPWPTGSLGRTIRSSPAPRSIASGITCSAAASSMPTTISATSNPPVNPSRCSTRWRRTSPPISFDLRHLVRTIVNSRTYQLSAVPNETNRDDETNFAHALVRPLQAEQLLDAVCQVTGSRRLPRLSAGRARPANCRAWPPVAAGGKRATDGEKFPRVVRQADAVAQLRMRALRGHDAHQAFQLITGPVLNRC